MPVVQGVTVARDQNLTFWNNTSHYGANLSNGTGGQNVNTAYFSEFVTSPDGSQHYYLDRASQSCSTYGSGIPCQEEYGTGNNVYPATDGSGYTPIPSASGGLNIVDTAGVVYAPGLITDVDGNTIQITSSGWTDSIGRVIPGASTNPGLPYATPQADGDTPRTWYPGSRHHPQIPRARRARRMLEFERYLFRATRPPAITFATKTSLTFLTSTSTQSSETRSINM